MTHSDIYHHCIVQVDNTNYDLHVHTTEDLQDMHNFYNNRHKVFFYKSKNKNEIISLETTTKIPKHMMMVNSIISTMMEFSNGVNVSCVKDNYEPVSTVTIIVV